MSLEIEMVLNGVPPIVRNWSGFGSGPATLSALFVDIWLLFLCVCVCAYVYVCIWLCEGGGGTKMLSVLIDTFYRLRRLRVACLFIYLLRPFLLSSLSRSPSAILRDRLRKRCPPKEQKKRAYEERLPGGDRGVRSTKLCLETRTMSARPSSSRTR